MSVADASERRARLERTIRAHHGVDFDAVLREIAYLRDPGDSVIVGGSLALGLGNHLSDLDVVVSGRGSTESSRVPIEHWVESLRVDVWKLSQADVDELFERADERLASSRPIAGAFGDMFEESDLKLLHRVAFGVHVDGPALVPTSARAYHEIARDLIVREYAERMREFALVAQLAAAAESDVAATTNARLAVQSALHATIAARGLPFTGDKWLGDRIAGDQPELAAVHDSFLDLPDAGEPAGELVRAAVATCEGLAGCDLSAATLARAARWDPGDLSLVEAGRERYLLSVRLDGLWELAEPEAAAWAALGEGPWPCDAGEPATRRLLFDLYANGLLALGWERGVPLAELSFGAGEAA